MLHRKRLFRHLPPTAVPLAGSDLWRGLAATVGQRDALDQFRSVLMEQTGSPDCYLVSSGRAGLALILLGLKRLSGRSQVIVPAYACPTVVQSVLKAGLEPVLCDVSPQTLDLDRTALQRLINSDVLAVVPVHLYGWAQDVRDLIAMGEEQGFYVVEDAAQSFGATFQGQMVGSWGDAGFYSLGRGKCIPTGHGGVIVCHERYAPAISGAIEDSGVKSVTSDIASLLLFAAYGLATHPVGWWFVARTPLNPKDAGMDAEALPPIELRGLSATQAGIGISILARWDGIVAARRHNALRLMALLHEFDFVSVPEIASGSEPVLLRLPFVVKGEERANRLFDLLHREGMGVSRSYWRTLPDLFSAVVPSSEEGYPGASCLASCLLTLPTHGYVREEDFERIADVLHMVNHQGD